MWVGHLLGNATLFLIFSLTVPKGFKIMPKQERATNQRRTRFSAEIEWFASAIISNIPGQSTTDVRAFSISFQFHQQYTGSRLPRSFQVDLQEMTKRVPAHFRSIYGMWRRIRPIPRWKLASTCRTFISQSSGIYWTSQRYGEDTPYNKTFACLLFSWFRSSFIR